LRDPNQREYQLFIGIDVALRLLLTTHEPVYPADHTASRIEVRE